MDVLVTIEDPKTKQDITKVVLEDILVLATGVEVEKNEKKGEGEKTSPVDVYTLEVTPDEGEKLSLAATQGKLHFALRNAIDKETVLTAGATIPKTLSSYQSDVQLKPEPKKTEPGEPKPKPERAAFNVEIIKGDKVSGVKF